MKTTLSVGMKIAAGAAVLLTSACMTKPAPADANLSLTPFAYGAGPDVVPTAGSAAVFIFQYVEVNAVGVRKLRARIGP